MAQKPQKKENLPVKVDVDLENGGTISYANEVIATIAGVAANEIDGIAGMSVSGGIGEILGRNRNITRGVKVEVGSQEAAVDLYIVVEYGQPIQKVAADVQENVRRALESLTGLHVVRVDVHVQGVSFEREKKATQNILEASKTPVLAAPAQEEKGPKEEKNVKEEKAPKAKKPVKKETPPTEESAAETAAVDEPAAEKPAANEPAAAEIADPEFDPQVLSEQEKLDGAEGDPAETPAEKKPAPGRAPRVPGRKRC